MKLKISTLLALASIVLAPLVLTSCYTEDPGPLQQMEKEYDLTDFDRLEMGDAFVIRVEQGNFYSISVRGDERNINDLVVKKVGTTLAIRFDDNHNRNHQTFIDITMPSVLEANFSGSTNSVLTGFTDSETVKISLSGSSVSQFDGESATMDITLSGSSTLTLDGSAVEISAGISGSSTLKAFDFPVEEAYINASGASNCKVAVSDKLTVTASGASSVLYRGSPSVTSNVSGSSSVSQD
jgi:hypothetical protein